MGQTFQRQDLQLASTLDSLVGFLDNVAPTSAMESGAGHIADDLNNVRSMLSYLANIQSGNWYDAQIAPTALETGILRGVDNLNDALHLLEKKRVLRDVYNLIDVTVLAGDNFVILGAGQLPTPTNVALGAVTTLGTVIAAHGGTFGTHSLAVVPGTNALDPLNRMVIVDGVTRDPLLSGDRIIYGLLQAEIGLVDGGTMTTTTTTRGQISFVRSNATGDGLEAVPFADIENKIINFATRERVRLEDLNEADFLSGSIVDVPAGTTTTRQVAYTNQGATIVTTAANATLDLATGLSWEIGDVLSAMLFQIIEGSGGGTSQVNVGAAVDELDIDAILVNIASGVSVRTGGTRPIDVGINDGLMETIAGDLEVKSAADLILNDANMAGAGTWTGPGVKVSDTQTEVTDYETIFGGEVSLMRAAVLAVGTAVHTKVQAVITTNVTAGTDVNGPGTPHNNTDVDLPPYDLVGSFVDDVDVYINGELGRNDAASGGTNDVFPGGTPTEGDLAFNFDLTGTGSKPDQLTVEVRGQ